MADKRLGTFAGVFTPSVLTILGIILFLRLGYVTGAAGVWRALLIVALANVISILTSVSLSAIATNLRVRGGGDYYLISRTLGVEYGGALGLVLFIAQSVSIAFYAIGFGEAVAFMAGGNLAWLPQATAAVAVAGLFLLAWLGADWATRFQYGVMAVLAAAIVAFVAGALPEWSSARLVENFDPAVLPEAIAGGGLTMPFWVAFALFFPAVTGFTQGVSMSGDLEDAGRSLPLGTFAAVGVSIVVYVGVTLLFAGAQTNAELVADYGAMRRGSLVPWLVDAGVIAATLSSALASFLGAPRILQSLAADRVFPVLHPFAAGSGPANNPRRGVLLSAGIAMGTIALGDLNVIAPVVSMFFLISYGLLNYATYVEASARSPSFRPRFRWFHARLSLAGFVGCLAVMLAIHPTAAIVSVLLLIGIYQYVASSVGIDRWADSGRSHRFQRVREDLHAIAGEPEHPRYWRPVLLAFSDDPERRARLLRFASWLEGGSGLTSLVQLIEGSENLRSRQLRTEAEKELRDEIARHGLPAFPRAIVTRDVERAFPVVLQGYGLGPVRANTVLINWLDPDKGSVEAWKLRRFGQRLRLGLRYGCNVVVLGADGRDVERIETTPARARLIDVWHRDNASGRLMLMLAYLMTRTPTWEDARIRLFAPPTHGKSAEETLAAMERMLDEARIVAAVEVVESVDTRTIAEHSLDATAVFLPMTIGEQGPACVHGSLEELLPVLGMTALVLAAQDIELDAQPEGGEHGERAQAADEAEKAERAARNTAREAEAAGRALERARGELEAARARVAEAGEIADLEAAVEAAERELGRQRRREAKARVKADSAAESAHSLTRTPEQGESPTPDDPESN
jgi:amino acid transporter